MTVSGCSKHLKDSLCAEERNDQILLVGRYATSCSPVAAEEVSDCGVDGASAVTKWPDAGGEVPHQPVDIGLFPVKKGRDLAVLDKDIPWKCRCESRPP